MNLQKRVQAIYKRRQEAHNVLLECDKELDKIIQELAPLDMNKMECADSN